jgi:hypothetical protein
VYEFGAELSVPYVMIIFALKCLMVNFDCGFGWDRLASLMLMALIKLLHRRTCSLSYPTVLFFPKNRSQIIKYPSENHKVDALLGFVQALQ